MSLAFPPLGCTSMSPAGGDGDVLSQSQSASGHKALPDLCHQDGPVTGAQLHPMPSVLPVTADPTSTGQSLAPLKCRSVFRPETSELAHLFSLPTQLPNFCAPLGAMETSRCYPSSSLWSTDKPRVCVWPARPLVLLWDGHWACCLPDCTLEAQHCFLTPPDLDHQISPLPLQSCSWPSTSQLKELLSNLEARRAGRGNDYARSYLLSSPFCFIPGTGAFEINSE